MKTTEDQLTKTAFGRGLKRIGERAKKGETSADVRTSQNETKEPIKRPFKKLLEAADKKVKNKKVQPTLSETSNGFTVVVNGVQVHIDKKPTSVQISNNRIAVEY